MSERQRVAHDVKAPLSVISGYAELLLVRNDETTRREAPARILEAVERLSAEIDGLLELVSRENETDPLGEVACRTIVLVDDDPTIRSLLRATLSEDVYEIVEAGDAASAVETIERERVDLVVLDWRLPDGDGGHVLAEVKARWPELPVIVLTAETGAAAERADAFLTKPFSPVELLDLVDRLLRTG